MMAEAAESSRNLLESLTSILGYEAEEQQQQQRERTKNKAAAIWSSALYSRD